MQEGPNKGRDFYCCSKPREEQCQFFQWCDQAPTTSYNNPGIDTETREEQCQFFQWCDQAPTTSYNNPGIDIEARGVAQCHRDRCSINWG